MDINYLRPREIRTFCFLNKCMVGTGSEIGVGKNGEANTTVENLETLFKTAKANAVWTTGEAVEAMQTK